MRSFLTLLCGCAGIATLHAQTLTGASNNMIPGDVFVVHYGPGAAPGGSGSINWNYADLVETDSPETFAFLAPAGSPYAPDFPTATLRIEDSFLRGDATGLYSLGYGDPNGSMIYGDPEKQFAYPCSYMTSWTDNFSGSDGNGSSETGTISGTADGTGALVLPYGTVSNVLRLHLMMSSQYTFNGNTLTSNSDAYYYLKPGVRFPVLTADPNGASIGWLDQSSVGVEELLAHDIGVDVFPNPATDAVDVVYGASGEHFTLDLIDISGAVVQHLELGAGSGILKQHVDLTGVAKGLYTVRITDAKGGQGVRRVVVQ